MRRIGIITTVSLALVIAGAGTVVAAPAPTVVVRSNSPVQGGYLRLVAAVRNPVRRPMFRPTLRATAVVHFASGDVTVNLRRFWFMPNVVRARVSVPADQPAGPLAVDMRVTYFGVTQNMSLTAMVQPSDDEPPPPPPPPPPPEI